VTAQTLSNGGDRAHILEILLTNVNVTSLAVATTVTDFVSTMRYVYNITAMTEQNWKHFFLRLNKYSKCMFMMEHRYLTNQMFTESRRKKFKYTATSTYVELCNVFQVQRQKR